MSSFINGNHIIIGVGGTGGNILKAIRKRYFQEVPSAETRRTTPLGFVYVDSSKELMKPNDPTWKVLGENSQLGNDSFLFVRDASLGSQLENVDDYPGIRSWIGNRKIWDNLVGSVGDDGAAAQRRRLGRFLFSCAVNKYESILKNQVNEVTTIGGKADVTFHIIAGLAGGTGSGSVVDVIAQTRKHFPPNINSGLKYKILVYCLVPESEPLPDWDKGFYHANGFAALQELNALQVKRYIPHDVSGEYEFVPLDGVDKVFNTCFLFTNINENGIPVNTKDALPEIVSDFIFHYLCLQVDDTTRRFEDAYTGENIVDTHENDENARTVEIANEEKPVRTCHFNAFGIKRIVSPEEEIIEYFTYNFARQALLQFKYNNWSDDLGYRDQPRNEDYITFVNDKATLNSWMLSEPHLMLSLPILASEKDQKWRTFQDDWNANIPRLANVAWEKNPSRAINELAKFCDERFEKNFRKVGVPEFYKIKEQARKDIAKEVVDTVGRELFSQWQTGQKSVYEIGRLMVTLIAQTEKRLKSFDGMIISKIGEIDEKYATKAQNEQTWASYGVIPKWLGRKKDLFQAQTTLMQQLYIKKTELEGLRFGKKLLAEIINEMQLLNDEIKSFLDILTQALTASEKEIASRCREKRMSAETLKETVVIKYYDTQEVKKFTDRLIRDQTIQPGQSASIRNLIADLAGSEKTFKVLNEHASEDVLMDIFSQKARDSSIQAHNQLITNKKQKLIGVNIVEKLKEQYGSSDKQTELNDFARNIMESSGVFLTFNRAEVTRHLSNNPPPQPGKLTMMNSTLISIPESPDNKDFVDKLVDAFKHNSDGSKTIYTILGNKIRK
ncbi:MAG: tubulin-like doman-containing protein [Tannerella sp.]|jgi:hypothetical protein|nr:tubulin-like doman-containing protein [Tannerella sp.]